MVLFLKLNHQDEITPNNRNLIFLKVSGLIGKMILCFLVKIFQNIIFAQLSLCSVPFT